jgi:hypothetical protein
MMLRVLAAPSAETGSGIRRAAARASPAVAAMIRAKRII